jgi:hypothetical protein
VLEDGMWVNKIYNYLPSKKCSKVPYTKEKEAYYNISLQNWNCIDFENVTLGGNWDGNFVYGLIVFTRQCTQAGRNCSDLETVKNFISSNDESNALFYSDLSLEVYPSMDDFENPLKTHFVNHYEIMNMKLYKRKIQTFKSTSIVDDQGWFFSDISEKTVVASDSINYDFTLKNETGNDILFNQLIYYGRKAEIYNRSYTKLQEILAAIGGFAKFIFFILNYSHLIIAKTYKNLYLIANISFEKENDKILNTVLRHRILERENVFKNNDHQNIEGNFEKSNLEIKSDNHQGPRREGKLLKTGNDQINLYNKPDSFANKNFTENNENRNAIVLRRQLKHQTIFDAGKQKFKNLSSKCLSVNKKPEVIKKEKNLVTNNRRNSIVFKVDYIDYLKSKLCFKKTKDLVTSNILENFSIYKSYFEDSLDILTYFKLLNEFKNVKKLLLDKNERKQLKLIKPKLLFKTCKEIKTSSLYSNTGSFSKLVI